MRLYSLVRPYAPWIRSAKERGTGEGSEKKKPGKGKRALSYSYNTPRVLIGMGKMRSSIEFV